MSVDLVKHITHAVTVTELAWGDRGVVWQATCRCGYWAPHTTSQAAHMDRITHTPND